MIASAFYFLTSPSLLWLWEWLEFLSIIIVGIGCWGELWAEHHKFAGHPNDLMPLSSINKRWVRRFWLMVVWGLGAELVAFGFTFLASNREIEGLRSANLKVEKQLAELRSANIKLEGELGWVWKISRTRNIPDRNGLIAALKDSPKAIVEIVCVPNDQEAFSLAIQIAACLKDAKWSVLDPKPIPENVKLEAGTLFVGDGGYPPNTPLATRLGAFPGSMGVSILAKTDPDGSPFKLEGGEFPWKTDTAARALRAAFIYSGFGSPILQVNPNIKEGMVVIAVGQKVW